MNKPHSINLFSMLITLALFAGCSINQSSGIQLAAMDQGSGFGGTGIILYSDEEGSSGFGGTGIIGNIEAFGSIWVNGIEIDYEENVEIRSNLVNRDEKLKLGHSVILETNTELNQLNRPSTELITIYYPFAGIIQEIKQDKILINDQWIQVTEQTLRDEGLIIEVGSFVAINAIQHEDLQWIASRLNHNPQNRVINQSSVDIQFSSNIQQIVLDERLQYLQSLWRMDKDLISSMKRSRIPVDRWNSQPHFKPMNIPRASPNDGVRPVQLPQQFRDIRDIQRTINNLPPPEIRQDRFIPPNLR